MSQENVEIVRTLFDLFARRDHEAAFDYYDADIEWDASRAGVDAAGNYPATTAYARIGVAGCRHGRTSKQRRLSSSMGGDGRRADSSATAAWARQRD